MMGITMVHFESKRSNLSLLANIILVYPQRFTAHLWNGVRSSRLRLHQVILRQCHILLSSSLPENGGLLVAQKAKSEAKILFFALEISASVPQLAGYLEQVERDKTTHPAHPEKVFKEGPVELPHLAKQVCSNMIEYRPQIMYDQYSKQGVDDRVPKPSHMSVFYADCNDGEILADAPAQGKFSIKTLKLKRSLTSYLPLYSSSPYGRASAC